MPRIIYARSLPAKKRKRDDRPCGGVPRKRRSRDEEVRAILNGLDRVRQELDILTQQVLALAAHEDTQ